VNCILVDLAVSNGEEIEKDILEEESEFSVRVDLIWVLVYIFFFVCFYQGINT